MDLPPPTERENLGIMTVLRVLIEELFPYFRSTTMFRKSLHRLQQSLLEEPCSTMFYLLVLAFGFIPFLTFVLFVIGSFLLAVVCFCVSQAIVLTISMLVFGGFMIFIAFMCCWLAGIFGTCIHISLQWGSFSQLCKDIVQGFYMLSHDKLAEYGIVEPRVDPGGGKEGDIASIIRHSYNNTNNSSDNNDNNAHHNFGDSD